MRCNDPEVLLLLLLLPFFFRVAHWTLADQPRPSCALFQSAGHSSAEESEPCRTLFSSPAGARALLLFLLCRSSFVFCLFFFLAAPAIKNERSVPPPFLDRIDLGRQKLNDATTASRAETALPHTQTPKKKEERARVPPAKQDQSGTSDEDRPKKLVAIAESTPTTTTTTTTTKKARGSFGKRPTRTNGVADIPAHEN